jgi:hypothetical protein
LFVICDARRHRLKVFPVCCAHRAINAQLAAFQALVDEAYYFVIALPLVIVKERHVLALLKGKRHALFARTKVG